ncbi:MAG: amidohydrolase family protein [Spirochaetaceae bacterium]|jgi:dihydroorotase|nr:amidohydrolase family protein [Spirochaetaceae bacterium]
MAQRILLKNFRIVDANTDKKASVLVQDGIITDIIDSSKDISSDLSSITTDMILDGDALADGNALLLPAFIDLHAHFRQPAFHIDETPSPLPETLESASLAAAAGGYGTLVCMANTKPPIDTVEAAEILKKRADAIGLIDLYPAVALTKNMEGYQESEILALRASAPPRELLLLSEDGKDIPNDTLFIEIMKQAAKLNIPIACHCDQLNNEAASVERVLRLAEGTGCKIHICHVSTKDTIDIIRKTKLRAPAPPRELLTAEATPHHIGATEDDAIRMGIDNYGRVNPPLATETDRQAVIAALADGTIDAIATDHAPHSDAAKRNGAPGFVGLETAFAVCNTVLINREPRQPREQNIGNQFDLRFLSKLMSFNPAKILGLKDRGLISPGLRADLVIVDPSAVFTVDSSAFKSRGHCTPFDKRQLRAKILMTLQKGTIVYESASSN